MKLFIAMILISTSVYGGTKEIIMSEARKHNIPVWYALRIAHIETRLNCKAVGRAGERGPMQIKPSTARDLGYKGEDGGLSDCRTGAKYAMMYLRAALNKANGNLYYAAVLYNAGLYTKKKKSAYAEKAIRTRQNPPET